MTQTPIKDSKQDFFIGSNHQTKVVVSRWKL